MGELTENEEVQDAGDGEVAGKQEAAEPVATAEAPAPVAAPGNTDGAAPAVDPDAAPEPADISRSENSRAASDNSPPPPLDQTSSGEDYWMRSFFLYGGGSKRNPASSRLADAQRNDELDRAQRLDPSAAPCNMAGNIWVRRSLEGMDFTTYHYLAGALHWKRRFARIFPDADAESPDARLIIYREKKWPSMVKESISLVGAKVFLFDKITVRTRFRFTVTLNTGEAIDLASDTEEERLQWIEQLCASGAEATQAPGAPEDELADVTDLGAAGGTADTSEAAEVAHDATAATTPDAAPAPPPLVSPPRSPPAASPPAAPASPPAAPAPPPAVPAPPVTGEVPGSELDVTEPVHALHPAVKAWLEKDETNDIYEDFSDHEGGEDPEHVFPMVIEFHQRDAKEHRRMLLAAETAHEQQIWMGCFKVAVKPPETMETQRFDTHVPTANYTDSGPAAMNDGAVFFTGGRVVQDSIGSKTGKIRPHWENHNKNTPF